MNKSSPNKFFQIKNIKYDISLAGTRPEIESENFRTIIQNKKKNFERKNDPNPFHTKADA